MQLEFLQDEPKLTLMFPYKDIFNRVGGPSMISISVMDSEASDDLQYWFCRQDCYGGSADLCSPPYMVYGVLSLHKWSKIRNL